MQTEEPKIGVALSGGLDSSSVACAAAKIGAAVFHPCTVLATQILVHKTNSAHRFGGCGRIWSRMCHLLLDDRDAPVEAGLVHDALRPRFPRGVP